jgi:hypothetical protein
MALPASGQIKFSDINTEFGRSSTTSNTSLTGLSDGTVATINTANAASDRPDGAAPHAISEFYSYDHSASAFSWGTPSDTTINFDGNTGSTNYHALVTMSFTDGSGDTTASFTVTSGTVRGTMSLSVSTSGDPGIFGTSNSAGGYKVLGTSAVSLNKTLSGSGTLYMRFKYVAHSSLTENTLRTINIINSGVTNSQMTSAVLMTSGGGR